MRCFRNRPPKTPYEFFVHVGMSETDVSIWDGVRRVRASWPPSEKAQRDGGWWVRTVPRPRRLLRGQSTGWAETTLTTGMACGPSEDFFYRTSSAG